MTPEGTPKVAAVRSALRQPRGAGQQGLSVAPDGTPKAVVLSALRQPRGAGQQGLSMAPDGPPKAVVRSELRQSEQNQHMRKLLSGMRATALWPPAAQSSQALPRRESPPRSGQEPAPRVEVPKIARPVPR